MAFSVALEAGRTACEESIDAFVRAVDDLSEYELLGASRCHGWARLDVVVHVIAGWQEMLGGLVSLVDSEPSVDAATYWSAFASEYATDDPVPVLMAQRRRSAPASALGLARASVEAILGEPLPTTWSDTDATLIGTGRTSVPDGMDALGARLPVLS